MATMTSLLIATPPLKVASGVTTQPFLITRSAAICLPFFLSFSSTHSLQRPQSPYRLPLFQIRHDVLLAGVDVTSNDGHCRGAVASLHGFEQAQVLLVRRQATSGIVQTVGAALEHDALEHVTQSLGHSLVAGEPGDFEMHILIEDQTIAGEAVFDIPAVGVHLFSQPV